AVIHQIDIFKLLCHGHQLASWRREFQNEIYSLQFNSWNEIRTYCNLEKNNYETIVDNSISSINEISLTSNEYETMDNSVDIVEQEHMRLGIGPGDFLNGSNLYMRLCHVLSKAQRILDESKVLHNRQRFLDNIEEKLTPLENLVEDVLQHERRRTLPRTWKDNNINTQYYG
ncbi:3385_t:CDS:2, partial [Ambispora leptoticha]